MFIQYLVSITSLLLASYSLDCDCDWRQEVRVLQAQERQGELPCPSRAGCHPSACEKARGGSSKGQEVLQAEGVLSWALQ